MKRFVLYFFSVVVTLSVTTACVRDSQSAPVRRGRVKAPVRKVIATPQTQPARAGYAKATFAAGCFWCIQPPFDRVKGVIRTRVGYTGGVKPNPTYRAVAYGRTKHLESIEVVYDPKKVSYGKLLRVFWKNIDPTAVNRMFVDVGAHYRGVIFYHNESQRKQAEASKKALAHSKCFKRRIATEITKAGPFYAAEKYHQKFYIKSTYRYKRYHHGSGRIPFIKKYWVPCKALDYLK